MFCVNCGKEVADQSLNCKFCGTRLQEPTPYESGAVKGFFILLASFFTMPLKTMGLAVRELRELGSKGSLNLQGTAIPHLTWLQIASHLFATIVAIVALLAGLGAGIFQLKDIGYNFGSAIGGFFGSIIGGMLMAIFLDWLVMVFFEGLTLMIGIANDIKKIAQKN